MRILYYNAGENPDLWLPRLEAALPEADIREWKAGDNAPADYALVWKPPRDMLSGRTGLKAVFNLAAGVDAILDRQHVLPENVPIIRLEDAGMAVQMAEYVTHAVLRYFRHFDEYDTFASRHEWHPLESADKAGFTIGILGLGVMGKRVAKALLHFDFPVRGWSRTPRQIDGVTCFAGNSERDAFLNGTSVL
ncbi:MAG: glyoxylate/hydroxypyruvate reductase A, partial [Oxalobacter sp.]|nr:glyoxylate/hydroxypyruvate reductase A [Oxalobacter sp.]